MLIYLIFGCVVLMLVFLLASNVNYESFQSTTSSAPDVSEDIDINPEYRLREMLNDITRKNERIDMNQYIRRTGVEQSARAIAQEYCPVPADFNIDDYVKKSEIREKTCPKVPDLKDFVLKSSIPPAQQCPPCVCPKVKVQGGMCKACPKPEEKVCPPPKACGVKECKSIIKCAPGEVEIPPCDPCPAPQPCPTQPPKVCPAIPLPNPRDIKCPPCKYMGVKESKKDVNELINELIENDENDKLLKLKEKLNELDLQDPQELEKTIKMLKDKLRRSQSSHNHPAMNGKLDEILMFLQSLGSTMDDIVDAEDEDEFLMPDEISTTTVKPTESSQKCQSYPMKVKQYAKFHLG